MNRKRPMTEVADELWMNKKRLIPEVVDDIRCNHLGFTDKQKIIVI
jgi:hypothetical protein